MAQKRQRNISGLFMIVFVTIMLLLSFNIIKNNISAQNSGIVAQWINGHITQEIEAAFNTESPFSDSSKNIWTMLHFYLFKESRQNVIISEHQGDDWLFTGEEYDVPANAADNLFNNLNQIDKTVTDLKAKGIALHIAVIPSKARIYAARNMPPHMRQNLYPQIIDFLKQKDISHTTPLSYFLAHKDAPIFFKYDTHWSIIGADIMAQQIAANIATQTKDMPRTVFTRQAHREPSMHQGDLLRYLPFSDMSAHGFSPESYLPFTYDTSNQSLDADDLFGDTALPIALIGTSYSANPTWQFNAALKYALQIDIMNLAVEGFGPFHAMKQALASDFMLDTPPKIIIWEIPERYLLYPNGAVKNHDQQKE